MLKMLKEEYDHVLYCVHMEEGNKAEWQVHVSAVISIVEMLATRIVCHVSGHVWVSEDYASPNSGYMGITCVRCGEHHGQHLY